MRFLKFAWIAAVVVAPLSAQEARKGPEHVVIISIDGLRPEFYLDESYEAPTLKSLVRSGACAKGVESVYPSVTYAAHASIVTGVRPAKHGIWTNTKFGEKGGTSEWFWETKDFKAVPIWKTAREAKWKTAIIYWPTSVGADVDWLVPERWAVFEGEKTPELLLKHSTPGLLAEMTLAFGLPTEKEARDTAKIDVFITKGLCLVLKKYKPNLAFVHLIEVDHFQHEDGRDSKRVRAALKRVDEDIAAILKTLKDAGIAEKTAVVVVGDHGFEEAEHGVEPNAFLMNAGLIDAEEGKIKSWKAICHPYGGCGAVYARDAESAKKAKEVLESHAMKGGRRVYTVIDRPKLDELGFNPDAALAVDAEPGWMVLGGLGRDPYAGKPWNKGQHGYLPTNPHLYTGFIAGGPGFKKGAVVEKMRLIDIAPTLCRVMGLEMKGIEGHSIEELLETGK